jgi:hypothetical protein
MNGPLAYCSRPNSTETGLYLGDAHFVNNTPLQTEIITIEGFDALIDEYHPDFVMFGFYGYPRRGVSDMDKARQLVQKLLRQYARNEWGRFR